ncbi:MAG: SWIM zinc finger family protein [Actinomycetota bacterium]
MSAGGEGNPERAVAELVDEASISRLAPAHVLSAGVDEAERGGVRLEEVGPMLVTARVGYAHVELRSAGGLAWSCTCRDGQAGAFCVHVAAAAVETWRRARERDG